MNKGEARDYIVAGIEAMIANHKAQVVHLEAELRRLKPKTVVVTVGQSGPPPKRRMSMKARANIRKGIKARYARLAAETKADKKK